MLLQATSAQSGWNSARTARWPAPRGPRRRKAASLRAALPAAQVEALVRVEGEIGQLRLLHLVGRSRRQGVGEGDVARRLEVGKLREAMILYRPCQLETRGPLVSQYDTSKDFFVAHRIGRGDHRDLGDGGLGGEGGLDRPRGDRSEERRV